MIRVYLTVPNGDAYLHKHVHFAVCRMLSDRRYAVRHDCPTHKPYENNLSHCMNDFLDGGEDFWVSMDTDNPPKRNPLDLVEFDCDLIGLPTPVWHSAVPGDRPFYYNAMREVDGGWNPAEPNGGLQEVDAVGSGCFIVARRVMLALRQEQPFARVYNPDGTVLHGGDFSFCRKVRAAGFRVWTHWGWPCEHFNTLPLSEAIERFAQMQPRPAPDRAIQ